MKVPNPRMHVPHEFFEGTLRFTGRDWAELIQKVTEYRKRAKLPPGEPEKEIYAQVCQRNPSGCRETGPIVRPKLLSGRLSGRVLEWLSRQRREEFVDDSTAIARADICAACPRQGGWQNECGACSSNANRLKDLLFDGRPQRLSEALLGCRSLGEDTRLSVWLNQTPVDRQGMPEKCWRVNPTS